MYFAHTEEQEEFRRSLRKFFGERLPHVNLPALLERDDVGTDFWLPMAQQLGLQGLTVSEQHGGSAFGMVELTIVLEEAGRALLPEPLFSTVLGAVALELADGGGEVAAAVLPAVVAGRTVLTLALTDDEQDPARAERGNDGAWRLSGTKIRVPAGQLADTVLVFASTAEGAGLFAVDSSEVRVLPVRSLDLARPMATVELAGASALLVDDRKGLEKTLHQAGALLLAAEQVGGAGRCLDLAVEHAAVRTQFGRLIGSFQGVKHQCADMLVEYEASRTALMYAAWAWDDGADDRALATSALKAAASDAYWANARACIQVLGGIGFTTEHPAQLHFKRATVSGQLFGSADAHRELIVAHLDQGQAVPA